MDFHLKKIKNKKKNKKMKNKIYNNEENIQKTIENMKRLTQKIVSSKEKSLQFLIEAGICNENGKLSKNYGGSDD